MSTVVREVGVPVVPAVTEADVLRRAADLLEEFGWCQGAFGFDGTRTRGAREIFGADRFCVAGALIRANAELLGEHPRDGSKGDPWMDDLYVAFASTIGVDGYKDCEVANWNDAPGRTKAEVVQRLREAAEAAS